MKVLAYAKINLALDVINKRDDGYHNVKMIMQSIDMYDAIFINKSKAKGIQLKTNLPYIPTDERNLVYKAAKLLIDEFGIKEGVNISLRKFIPVAAGMAGGSSDCAATLRGINRLFKLGLPDKELMERGLSLGADVPYCLMGGTALAEGIGEKLTSLPPMKKCYILIGKPNISVSTKIAYGELKLQEINHPDIDTLVKNIKKNDLKEMSKYMENVFQPGIESKYPVIGEIVSIMKKNKAITSLMSGSGPTVFGIYDNEESLKMAKLALIKSKTCKTVFATTTINNKGGKIHDRRLIPRNR